MQRKTKLLIGMILFLTAGMLRAEYPMLNPEHPMRIPVRVDGKLIPRELGCWFPRAKEAQEPDDYKRFIDAVGSRTAFDMIAVSSRLTQDESNSPEAIAFQMNAARYSRDVYGMAMLPDAEIRLSRRAFQKANPERLQEILFFREQEQPAGESVEIISDYADKRDHYTHNYVYSVENVRLVKAWSYQKDENGRILPETIADATGDVTFTPDKLDGRMVAHAAFPAADQNRFVCAAAAFAFLYPDLYSQEALDFERDLFTRHRDVPAGGCVKDEWGFLPCHSGVPDQEEIYYSRLGAKKYAEQTGRDLIDDAFLMYRPQAGKEAERISVIDSYNKMNLETVLAYEYQLYDLTKEFWGPDAFPATHPTWYCIPDRCEFRKNSLMWWRHPRDYAQTDEQCPYPCRTGMSKTNGRLWYNEFYANDIPPYFQEHWSALLGGGRVNIHPFCCMENNPLRNDDNFGILPILDAGVERVRQRIRMLNFISDAPLYSPAAVVFGHFSVMNWARPEYNTAVFNGLDYCSEFSKQGYPADLIPSSQINAENVQGAPCWTVNSDGLLQYGNQPYQAVVFYADTDSDRADFEALKKMAETSKTALYTPENIPAAIEKLKADSTAAQTAWDRIPPMAGFARLNDGTLIWCNASPENPTGLPLTIDEEATLNDGRTKVKIEASGCGVIACRFDADGHLTALAGSEITKFCADGLSVDLTACAEGTLPDIALWKTEEGQWKGIFQSCENTLPAEWERVTGDWRYLQANRPAVTEASAE